MYRGQVRILAGRRSKTSRSGRTGKKLDWLSLDLACTPMREADLVVNYDKSDNAVQADGQDPGLSV